MALMCERLEFRKDLFLIMWPQFKEKSDQEIHEMIAAGRWLFEYHKELKLVLIERNKIKSVLTRLQREEKCFPIEDQFYKGKKEEQTDELQKLIDKFENYLETLQKKSENKNPQKSIDVLLREQQL